jgi:hypothetical protein
MDSFSNSILASAGPAGGSADDGCDGIGCAPGLACCAQLGSNANAKHIQPMKMLVLAGMYFIATGPLRGPLNRL